MLFHLNEEYMTFGEAMIYLMHDKHLTSNVAFEYLESLEKK